MYSFGANGEGQLGLGQTEPSFSSPQLVESMNNIPLKMISAGADHVGALTGQTFIKTRFIRFASVCLSVRLFVTRQKLLGNNSYLKNREGHPIWYGDEH